MRNRLLLFATMSALGGFMAATGSILGNAFGKNGLYAGAILGGLIGVVLAAKIAVVRKWIRVGQLEYVALGGSIGFLCAAAVAVATISSPVGPVLSTLLIGGGALFAEVASTR